MLITTVRADQVVPHPKNIRRDVGDVTELADSLKTSGMLQPIVVAPAPAASKSKKKAPAYLLIAGHRRFAAAKVCGWKELDAIVRDDLDTDAKQIEAMAIENLQRTNLTPVEEAHAYQELLDLGYTPAKIAKQTGRNAKTVKLRLGLNKLSDKASEKLHAGQITLEQAEVLASFAKDPKAYAALETTIGTTNFGWQVQRIKEERTRDATRQKLFEQLRKEGVTVIDAPRSYPYSSDAKPLDTAVHGPHGLGIDPAEHASCGGHAAIVADGYRGARIEYVCTDPVKYGHREPNQDSSRSVPRQRTPEEEAQLDAAERRRADLDTAVATRREFVGQCLKARLTEKHVLAIARAVVIGLIEDVHEFADADPMYEVLSIPMDDDASGRLGQRVAVADSLQDLSALALAAVFALNDPGRYDWSSAKCRALVDMLVALGYELSDVERAELDKRISAQPIAPFACRICGCTEGEACEGGCEWFDDEATICTACVDENGNPIEKAEREVEDVEPAGEFAAAL